jgi:hypothetical protein
VEISSKAATWKIKRETGNTLSVVAVWNWLRIYVMMIMVMLESSQSATRVFSYIRVLSKYKPCNHISVFIIVWKWSGDSLKYKYDPSSHTQFKEHHKLWPYHKISWEIKHKCFYKKKTSNNKTQKDTQHLIKEQQSRPSIVSDERESNENVYMFIK